MNVNLRQRPRIAAFIASAALALMTFAPPVLAVTRVTVKPRVLNRVDHRLFGVMAERADWSGETGTEGAWDVEAHTWRKNFVRLWDRLGATVVRFPGGGVADAYDWRWGIDNVPGRTGPRPVTRRAQTEAETQILPPGTPTEQGVETHYVGTDEMQRLCERTGAQLSLTVNVMWFKDDYPRGAALAADWVEYCNAPNDGKNPNGGVDWARVRAKNGHPKPYNVHLWEIGNEIWLLRGYPRADYGKQVAVYADAMRKVDPSIALIADGQTSELRESVAKYAGKRVQFIALHHYEPWEVDLKGMTAQQVWDAAASLPTSSWERRADDVDAFIRRTRLGYRAALTEWNIHGWWNQGWNPRSWDLALPKYVPFGLSMAAWFQDLFRRGDRITLADASMLAGSEWANTLFRFLAEPGRPAVGFIGSYVFRLYAHNTGDRRLEIVAARVPTYDQPLRFGDSPPRRDVPILDTVATRDGRALYLAVVNRSRTDALPMEWDLSAFPALRKAAGKREWLDISGMLTEPGPDQPEAVRLRTAPVRVQGGTLTYTAPPRSVTIITLPLRAKS